MDQTITLKRLRALMAEYRESKMHATLGTDPIEIEKREALYNEARAAEAFMFYVEGEIADGQ